MYFEINEKNRVVLQIHDKFSADIMPNNVTSFKTNIVPEVKQGEVLFYNPDTGVFYTEKPEISEDKNEKAKAEARRQKEVALKWLSDNDWKVNKHTLGEWADDDPRWLEYLAGREQARSEYDEAEAILKG